MRWPIRRGAPEGDPWGDPASAADPHVRARALAAIRLTEPLQPEHDAWLAAHLAACETCSTTQADYVAGQALLRTLRDQPQEPPRDLWARTSIALERESGKSLRVRRASHPDRSPDRPMRGWPTLSLRRPSTSVQIASGVLVLALAVTSLVFNGINRAPAPSDGRPGPTGPGATPITVAADVGWLQPAEDGSYEIFIAHVGQVCPQGGASGCAPIQDVARTSISLGALPESVSYSAAANQLVVVSSGPASAASVLVVPVPTPAGTDPTAAPSHDVGATPTGSVPVTVLPSGSPSPSGSAVIPTADPDGPVASPSGSPTTGGAVAIAENVIVVGGSAAYSTDGSWLAFAARPSDLSAGPDVYVWKVGDPVAHMVTNDHRSVFSAWLGNRLLGTRVEAVSEPASDPTPGASPEESQVPGRVTPGDRSGSPSAVPQPAASAAVDTFTGVAFLLDPETNRSVDLDSVRYVRPVVDPTGRWVVYWEGSLIPVANGLDWQPGTGRLVVAPWDLGDGASLLPEDSDPLASPGAVPAPSGYDGVEITAPPTIAPGRSGGANGKSGPGASSPGSLPSPGTSGDPGILRVVADGPLQDFDARFDPTGTRLAVWVSRGESPIGSLSLFVLRDGAWEPEIGRGAVAMPALRGFSIGDGQLAWVAPDPSGGNSRRVQMLGWTDDGIGSVESVPGDSLIVIR